MASTVEPLAVDPASLVGLSFDELERRFAELPAPAPEQVGGLLTGRVLNVAGVESLPAPLRVLAARALSELTRVWVGKRFVSGSGANVWLRPGGPEFASFHGVLASSATGPVLRLDYAVASNPPPLRAIVGDVRRLAPGRMLARMALRIGGRELPILWFVLDS